MLSTEYVINFVFIDGVTVTCDEFFKEKAIVTGADTAADYCRANTYKSAKPNKNRGENEFSEATENK